MSELTPKAWARAIARDLEEGIDSWEALASILTPVPPGGQWPSTHTRCWYEVGSWISEADVRAAQDELDAEEAA